jgi:hypothetical protein
MNKIKVFKDSTGKIIGYTTSECESGEWADINNSEVQKLLNFEPSQTWEIIRQKRDELIKSSDWIFLPDVSLKNKEAWLTYRQALRDLPQNFSTPEEVIWPEVPSNHSDT